MLHNNRHLGGLLVMLENDTPFEDIPKIVRERLAPLRDQIPVYRYAPHTDGLRKLALPLIYLTKQGIPDSDFSGGPFFARFASVQTEQPNHDRLEVTYSTIRQLIALSLLSLSSCPVEPQSKIQLYSRGIIDFDQNWIDPEAAWRRKASDTGIHGVEQDRQWERCQYLEFEIMRTRTLIRRYILRAVVAILDEMEEEPAAVLSEYIDRVFDRVGENEISTAKRKMVKTGKYIECIFPDIKRYHFDFWHFRKVLYSVRDRLATKECNELCKDWFQIVEAYANLPIPPPQATDFMPIVACLQATYPDALLVSLEIFD